MTSPAFLALNDGRTLPERIADHFVAAIFTGAFAPGERLPAERQLALDLGIDRISLRMAMQRLAHLGLVKALRGSGVRVLDYRRHAGIDLLAALLALPDVALGGSFLIEMLDDWLDSVPGVLGRALARLTHESARQLDTILRAQLAVLDAGADLDRLTTLELELQEALADLVGSITLLLLNNSNRAMRRCITRMLFEAGDPRAHVEMNRELLRKTLKRSIPLSDLLAEYQSFLHGSTQKLRGRLQALPISPALVTPAATSPTKVKASRNEAEPTAATRPAARKSVPALKRKRA